MKTCLKRIGSSTTHPDHQHDVFSCWNMTSNNFEAHPRWLEELLSVCPVIIDVSYKCNESILRLLTSVIFSDRHRPTFSTIHSRFCYRCFQFDLPLVYVDGSSWFSSIEADPWRSAVSAMIITYYTTQRRIYPWVTASHPIRFFVARGSLCFQCSPFCFKTNMSFCRQIQ